MTPENVLKHMSKAVRREAQKPGRPQHSPQLQESQQKDRDLQRDQTHSGFGACGVILGKPPPFRMLGSSDHISAPPPLFYFKGREACGREEVKKGMNLYQIPTCGRKAGLGTKLIPSGYSALRPPST